MRVTRKQAARQADSNQILATPGWRGNRRCEMLRQNLSGRGGRWFDLERAQKFEEGSHFDGENFRSCATGGLWGHETLYRSANGRWILRKWSRVDGVKDRWIEIDAEDAAKWLIRNEYEELPSELRQYAADLQVA